MKEFIIYKDRWVRGDGWINGDYLGSPALLNRQNNMCCLGFLGKACGVSAARMINKTEPQDVCENNSNNYPTIESWNQFMDVNDNSKMTDRSRQDKLRRLFKKIGFKVSFKSTEKI